MTLETKNPNQPEGYSIMEQWGLIGIENDTGPFTTASYFDTSSITVAFEAGHYRFVIFVGGSLVEQVYAEFNVTD